MELTFNKVGNTYIAEYQATTHFNLHIEGGGRVLLYKRTSGEQWDTLASVSNQSVFDADIAVNFPKEYRFVLTNKASLVVIMLADGTIINGVLPDEPSGDIPEGYEEFLVTEGVFSASDGAFYVKL